MTKLEEAAKAYRESMKDVEKIPAAPKDQRARGDWTAFAHDKADHAEKAHIELLKVAREEPEK